MAGGDDQRRSFFGELKRRNVFRVGVAYVAVSWVLLQIADVVFQFLELPSTAGKFMLVFLALSLFPVLFFAWAYEITPEGIKRETEVNRSSSITHVTARKLDYLTIGLVIFGVAFVVFDRAVLQRQLAVAPPTQEAMVETAGNSIAVLPFADMSPEGDQEYFSDGISEELLNLLVRVKNLRVASRTSSFAYKEQPDLNISEIAQELQVNHILEGSVRKAGNRLRITAQLIDTGTDQHLWSDTFDRELDDIFAIQDEIANSIVAALRDTLEIAPEEAVITVEPATENLDAYDLFLKSREMFIARSRENLPSAIETAKRAVELDPNFARAWELLAALYSVAPSWGVGGDDYQVFAAQAVDRALELKPDLAFAYAIKSQIMQYGTGRIGWDEVMRLIHKSLELEPKDATVYLWRGIYYRAMGFVSEAAEDFDHCLELDPAYENCFNHRTMVFFDRGDVDTALARFDEQLANARVRTTHWDRYVVPDFVRSGDRRAALLAAAPVLNNNNQAVNDWVAALEHPDEDQSGRIDRLATWMNEADLNVPIVWMTTGEYDRIQPGYFTSIAMWRADVKDFRQSDDFKRVIRDGGMEAYWRANGFPPQCRPLGADDFECE